MSTVQSRESAARAPGSLSGKASSRTGPLLLSIGAASVVVTSALYAMAPVDAVLQALDGPPGSEAAARAGAAVLRWAGTSGILGNLVMAAGALLIAVDRERRGHGRAAGGWALIVMSLVVFEVVDGLVGFALPVAAEASPGVYPVVRSLYAAFFLAGTFLFGVGAILAIDPGGEHGWRRWLAWSAVAESGAALVSAGAGFFGVAAAAPLVGVSIAAGAVTFAVIGVDMATAHPGPDRR